MRKRGANWGPRRIGKTKTLPLITLMTLINGQGIYQFLPVFRRS
jgi:hypothetical protein